MLPLMMSDLSEHVAHNRAFWNAMAGDWNEPGERSWKQDVPTWGNWGVSDDQAPLLPLDMRGIRAIELGCGTGYVSAWMTRRGAKVVGIDNSEQQLATAKRLRQEHALEITFIHGNAEEVPYPDGSFDFAVSEYGAAIWCDPYRWIPEARRLLRPGGRLVFLGTHPLAVVCSPEDGSPCDDRLHRSYLDMHVQDYRRVAVDPGGVEFNLSHSGWLRLFRETGLQVIDYLELAAPPTATDDQFSIPADWAKRWPSEQVWKLEA